MTFASQNPNLLALTEVLAGESVGHRRLGESNWKFNPERDPAPEPAKDFGPFTITPWSGPPREHCVRVVSGDSASCQDSAISGRSGHARVFAKKQHNASRT